MKPGRLLARVLPLIALAPALAMADVPINSYGYNPIYTQPMVFSFSASSDSALGFVSIFFGTVSPSVRLSDPSTTDPTADAGPFVVSSLVSSVTGAQGFVTTNAQDTVSGITSIRTMGGMTISAGSSSLAGGGTLVLRDFVVNLANHTVDADVTSGNGLVSGHVDVFAIGSLSGPNAVVVDNFDGLGETTFSLSASNLSWTQDGQTALANALGFSPRVSLMLAQNPAAGSLSISAVPEPTTYVLLGSGLAALAAVARGRAR
jgi:hypothetical protein